LIYSSEASVRKAIYSSEASVRKAIYSPSACGGATGRVAVRDTGAESTRRVLRARSYCGAGMICRGRAGSSGRP